MATLCHIGGEADDADKHIVFIHGLNGSVDETWSVKTPSGIELWPRWLVEDLPNVAVWAVGYDVSWSAWTGHALLLEDRAQNIWGLLRAEPRLHRGEIEVIGHCMGGLVGIQLLRCIDRDKADPDAESFVARMRRFGFLGTPHRGSQLASMLSSVAPLLPTVAITDLRSSTPQLRDLSGWFHKQVRDDQIQTIQPRETRRLRLWGIPVGPEIVSPDCPASAPMGGFEVIV